MKVIKRNGESAEVRFDQITDRLKFLAGHKFEKQLDIDAPYIAQRYVPVSTTVLVHQNLMNIQQVFVQI